MATTFPNIYTLRKVAETAAKACDICYKSSTSVLITPDQKQIQLIPLTRKTNPPPPEEEPRVFELKTAFYQQRLLKKRQAEAAKADRERASKPGYFPSVPSDAPSR
ncbi:VPS4-associated protein 1 [Fusarium oxysporum f. sp. vasinfectum]|nr:VPS4-associated protein 1 [Fusarium oxysporum f. sp. vasinfectum]